MKRITKEILLEKMKDINIQYEKRWLEMAMLLQMNSNKVDTPKIPLNIVIAHKWYDKPLDSHRFNTYREAFSFLVWYENAFDDTFLKWK